MPDEVITKSEVESVNEQIENVIAQLVNRGYDMGDQDETQKIKGEFDFKDEEPSADGVILLFNITRFSFEKADGTTCITDVPEDLQAITITR